jgi:1-acyl-sn-glycerol-3-phosphate acyltransferase
VRFIWIKEVRGIQNIPRTGPAIVAFNHQSYFDFLCFIAICPRNIHFLAAEKFFTHPLWSVLMKATGQIRVNRTAKDKRAVHNMIYEHLDNGKLVGIFPEGTRAPDKEKMLLAFTGVAKYAIKKRVPVIPVGLRGTFDVMSRHDTKPHFLKIVSIIIGAPVDLKIYLEHKMNKLAYRVITNRIMFTISALSEKPYPYTQIRI